MERTQVGRWDRGAAVGSLAALAVVAVVGPRAPLGFAGVVTAALLAVIAPPTSRTLARAVGLLAVAASVIPIWQAAMGMAVAAFFAVERRRTAGLAAGGVPVAATMFAAAVTPGALVGWYLFARPSTAALLGPLGPILEPLPAWAVAGCAIAFVLVNATLEEVIWRGVVAGELDAIVGAGGSIVLQAASFGIQHAHGFPRGPIGVALVFVWALILGVLRRTSGGLLAPWLAHIVADSVIAAILALAVLREGAVLPGSSGG